MGLAKIKTALQDMYDMYLLMRARATEKRKFRDPRRVEIWAEYELSKDQCKKIDTLYLENYGKKIPYIWHRHFSMFTGKFDVTYFPELLYVPEFERFMNDSSIAEALSDKNLLPLIANSLGIKMPNHIVSRVRGIYHDSSMNLISENEAIRLLENSGTVFAKPSIDTSSGEKCVRLCIKNGVVRNSEYELKTILEGLGQDFCIQQCVICHESIRKIYAGCVNTFRVITYIWKNEVCTMPVIMRIGMGGAVVDNAHAGGMFIAVSDDGILHEKAFTEFKKEYEYHPDTGLIFKDYRIYGFKEILFAAKRMHGALNQLGVINWDFTIDEGGNPVLIEANINGGSIWMIEMAHGIGCFGERTPEILRWMQLMKHIPKSQRRAYLYGKMHG